MKIEELSIGDYVSYKDKIVKIESLDSKNNKIGITNCDNNVKTISLNEIEPIDTTAEILEKFDFIFLKEEGTYYDTHISLVPMGFNGPYRIAKTIMFIEYVHELQHAIRLCCNFNKEVNLWN